MRILIISHDETGGALASALAERGHQVTLIAPAGQPASQPSGLRWVKAPNRSGSTLEVALAALVTKEAAFRRPKAAIVSLNASTHAVPHALRNLRVPTILTLGPELDLQRIADQPLRLGALMTVVARAQSLVCPSEAIAQRAVNLLRAAEASVVEPGLSLGTLTPTPREQAKAKLGLHEGIRLLAMVGPLDASLRLDLVAHAHRKLSGVGLLIVGDGPGADFVQAMRAATRPSAPVLYMGAQPEETIRDALFAAHAVLDPRAEGPSRFTPLALALGRRCVGFQGEGWSRLQPLYPAALSALTLVEATEPQILKRALEETFWAEEEAPIPASAMREAQSALGWSGTAQKFEQVIEEIRRKS